ncbi:prepilin-type N-terminal cleavage/methylation domain-containing protein, partial [Tepidimonas sp.]|uniref:prepilin-type N-terminal cleavage/methylation domain-containing protein n=2 Tax=Tepidimonas sp. TaxID=2002775 RepID=UPI002FE2809A
PPPPIGRLHGLTLVEFLVVLAIVSILAAIATPSFLRQIERSRLESAAEAMYQVFRQARVANVRHSRDVYVLVDTGTNWKVWVSPESTCANRVPTEPCLLENIKLTSDDHANLSLSVSPGSLQTVTVDYRTGRYVDNANPTNTLPLTFTLTSASGSQLTVQAMPSGQIRLCDPGAGTTTRYPSC